LFDRLTKANGGVSNEGGTERIATLWGNGVVEISPSAKVRAVTLDVGIKERGEWELD